MVVVDARVRNPGCCVALSRVTYAIEFMSEAGFREWNSKGGVVVDV